MKVAVMTDSTAYISDPQKDQHNIHVVPLSVMFENTTYRESIDITTKEFYQKVKESESLPKTSQPSIGAIADKFEELAKDYDAVIAIHLSSGISGTYQTVVSGGEMAEGIEVYPFDSELSAMAQGFYVLEAAEMAEAGKEPNEIINRLEEIKQSIRAYFMVDDLSHLQRGGRLNGAQAIVGSLLQVKPVLHFVDKKIVPFEKIRTRKKALNRIIGMLEDDAKQGKNLKVAFIHANDVQTAIDLKNSVDSMYPNIDSSISHFGPVIGTHLGEGAVGVSWYKK
ncbi:DegV family protein [Virgibacillus litoralis]|uniref:DegV family protein with EDD domain n=1 Tax=Virgibacillus litoralis TaxID=578221 RepID=A0ABS4HBW6_9BACI|nr:DegV family protein [Virgibacillus litoralis]MBP1947987.1 DegV family protein with EDD domain [Virgibacillus litoralis]